MSLKDLQKPEAAATGLPKKGVLKKFANLQESTCADACF